MARPIGSPTEVGTVSLRVKICEEPNYLYRKHNDYAQCPDESNEYSAEPSLEGVVVSCNSPIDRISCLIR